MPDYSISQRRLLELKFHSSKEYQRPISDLELDCTFTTPSGTEFSVPGFATASGWHVRFTGAEPGIYKYITRCTDGANSGLHGQSGTIKVNATKHATGNPLIDHGRVRVHESGEYFCYADGTPFFWLADDWWHGTSKRLDWPFGFRELLADRKQKGFSMINMAIGLACDVSKEQLPGANEAGLPWGEDYQEINPEWFDMADLKVMEIAEQGLVPGIFFAWAYWITLLDEERMRRHVRYCVARWAALPVVWNLCGELAMPYYMAENKDQLRAEQTAAWTRIAKYVKEIDGYGSVLSAHPFGRAGRSSNAVTDPSVLDFEMLQGGHGDVRVVEWSLERTKNVIDDPETLHPIVMGETCFEGMYNRTSPFGQRMLFYGQFLNGLRGICYGAEGIWQMNTKEEPLGPSPHGQAWGNTPWREAMHFGGSRDMGIGKRLMEHFEWWRFERHDDWYDIPEVMGGQTVPYAAAAGIPGTVRVIYFAQPHFRWGAQSRLTNLEPDVAYSWRWFDPIFDGFLEPEKVQPGADGSWVVPYPPVMQDWVLVLEAT